MSVAVRCRYCRTLIGTYAGSPIPGREPPGKERVMRQKRRHERQCEERDSDDNEPPAWGLV